MLVVPSEEIRVAVAQLGARMHYAVPQFLHEHGLLGEMYTDMYIKDNFATKILNASQKLLSSSLLRKMLDRKCSIPDADIKSFPYLGLKFNIIRRMAIDSSTASLTTLKIGKMFNNAIIKHGGFNSQA